jgi:hypothetical protein
MPQTHPMVPVLKGGRDLHKPRDIKKYNSFMQADLKDQKLQPYKLERKRSTKW